MLRDHAHAYAACHPLRPRPGISTYALVRIIADASCDRDGRAVSRWRGLRAIRRICDPQQRVAPRSRAKMAKMLLVMRLSRSPAILGPEHDLGKIPEFDLHPGGPLPFFTPSPK